MRAADSAYYQEVAAHYPGKYGIVGISPKIIGVFQLIEAYNPITSSPIDVTVLITGPTGAGKNVVARAIHHESRRTGNFVSINCAALPHELLESELFGYERGSFTGAYRDKAGQFKVADGGTLHLDEIGLMHIKLQAKILAAVEDKKITRVGGTRAISVDVRIVASTNTDLEMAISRGQFREDLYHRLKVFPIYVPGLDERREDIPLLAQYLYEVNSLILGKPFVFAGKPVFGIFADYKWPGNVRQLENVVERMVTLDADPSKGIEKFLDATQLLVSVKQSVPDEGKGSVIVPLKNVAKNAIAEAEREVIISMLDRVHWNKTKAARMLGISSRALLYKIKGYRLVQDIGSVGSTPGAPVISNANVYSPNPHDVVQPPPPILPPSSDIVSTGVYQPLPLEAITPIKAAVKTAVAEAEREAIRMVLDRCNWNRSKASGVLKISYRALCYKIKGYGLRRENTGDVSYDRIKGVGTPIKAAVKTAVSEAEREAIRRVLDEVNWNRVKAASTLGISRPTLYNRIRKYELAPGNRIGAESAPATHLVNTVDVYTPNPHDVVQPPPILPPSSDIAITEARQPLPLEEVVVLEEGKAEGEKLKDSSAESQDAGATGWKPTEFERFKMERVLREARGDVSYAARLVGMTRDDFDTRWRVYTIKGKRR